MIGGLGVDLIELLRVEPAAARRAAAFVGLGRRRVEYRDPRARRVTASERRGAIARTPGSRRP